MAIGAYDLGYPEAAEELFRAAWVYAFAIDHHPLMARLRVDAANNVFWNEPKRSLELASAALSYQDAGPNAAYIYLKHGRAAARLGDADTARHSITEADEAREREHQDDDLLAIGGEFNFSLASQHYLAGATLIELPGGEREAGAELERAIELYDQGPEPGEDHAQTSVMCAHIDLATARLRAGQIDGAIAALEPVLALPPSRRFTGLGRRLARVQSEIAAPIFRGSTQASDLEDQVEEFGRESITTGLQSLSGGSGWG
jgi:tetratricopeptide (TPR) repeat protein